MIEQSAEIIDEIKRRALLFCVDNPRFGNHLAAIETAMMIGASIAMEQETEEKIHDVDTVTGEQPDVDRWNKAFGTWSE